MKKFQRINLGGGSIKSFYVLMITETDSALIILKLAP